MESNYGNVRRILTLKAYKIGKKTIGEGHPTYIIAEVSCNHRQDFDIALKTVEAIANSGADAVKLQTCTPSGLTLDCNRDEFIIKGGTPWDGRTLYDLYTETQTPWEWHGPLQKLAHELGLDFFSSPFDLEAVDFLESLDVPAYKIASFEAVDPQLINAAASKGKPIIISTGVASERDIECAIDACHSAGNKQIILLQCTSAYPAPLESTHLRHIPALAQRFDCLSGLSDHTNGHLASVGSVAVGGCMIEKHFILDRALGGPDAGFSMEPNEFSQMVDQVRRMERALGAQKLELDGNISENAKIFSRSLFAVQDINAGEILTHDNIKSIRPGYGLSPKHLNELIGMPAKISVSRGTPITWKVVK